MSISEDRKKNNSWREYIWTLCDNKRYKRHFKPRMPHMIFIEGCFIKLLAWKTQRRRINRKINKENTYPWINSFNCGHSSSSLTLFIFTEILSTTWIAILIFVERLLASFLIDSILWGSAPFSNKWFILTNFLSYLTLICSSAYKKKEGLYLEQA